MPPKLTQVLFCAATDEDVWKYMRLMESGAGNEAIKMVPKFNPVQLKTAYLLGQVRSEKRWKSNGK